MTTSIQGILKDGIMEQIRELDVEEIKRNMDKTDTITLYHGTNTYYLNSILENGILPQNLTGISNWDNPKALANENVVYLTNKWHYWYAYNSLEKVLERTYGENWRDIKEAQWYNTGKIFPIYLKINVPRSLCVLDEDIVYSKLVKDKISQAVKRDGDLTLNLTWEDCLAYHGTVGVLGSIPREYIESIHILADGQLHDMLMGSRTQYQKDFRKWMAGKGKGKLKNKDLQEIESRYKYTGHVSVKQFPPGYKVSQCAFDKKAQRMGVVLNTPKEYLEQPMQLEKI